MSSRKYTLNAGVAPPVIADDEVKVSLDSLNRSMRMKPMPCSVSDRIHTLRFGHSA